jgi:hypothetical protein
MARTSRIRIALLAVLLIPCATAFAQDPNPMPTTPADPATQAVPAIPATPPAVPADPAIPSPPATPATGASIRDAAGNPVIVVSRPPVPMQEDLQAEFAALDTNGDGAVSRAEARVDKYLVRAFAALDTNRDNRLQFEELRRWLDE